MNLCEIPFVSATTLDEALTSSGPGRSAIQKYRQEMRKSLDPGMLISVGRAGTVQLTSVPALACVATATRWNMKDARKLAGIYKKAGFSHLKKSKDFKNALALMSQAVKTCVRSAGAESSKAAAMDLIPGCWESLSSEQDVVRKVTCAMHDIFMKVDEELDEMKRLPGRLVRFEGENALITINTGEREELRLVDSGYLRSAGISRNGAPFVVHEYRWSPDTTMSVYFPAVDLDRDPAAEALKKARLKALEQPLPEPPPGLVPVEPILEKVAEPVPFEATHGREPAKAMTGKAEAPRSAARRTMKATAGS